MLLPSLPTALTAFASPAAAIPAPQIVQRGAHQLVGFEQYQANTAGVFPPEGLPSTQTLAATDSVEPAKAGKPSRKYINLTGFPFPLGPFTERRTVATEIVPGTVYGFEQEQSLSGITANVRSVVFRMRDNHLLVYNPVGPTEEFMRQLDALNHDGVSHILLGATTYEHKIFVGPFARRFPEAKIWAVPDQWSWPVSLSAPALGINTKGTGGGELVNTASGSAAYTSAPDLMAEFEVKLLRPQKRLGFGYAANEAAIYHKDTKTLALTDALVNVPATAPTIYDRTNLLGIGDNARSSNSLGNIILKGSAAVNWRGTAAREVEALFAQNEKSGAASAEDEGRMQRGWERNTLLSLYFGPSPASLVDPDASFQTLKSKWIVPPVVDKLIYRSDRVKPELARWVDDVAKWEFNTIAPAHFDVRPGNSDDFRAAFAPTLKAANEVGRPYDAGDTKLLDDLAEGLVGLKII